MSQNNVFSRVPEWYCNQQSFYQPHWIEQKVPMSKRCFRFSKNSDSNSNKMENVDFEQSHKFQNSNRQWSFFFKFGKTQIHVSKLSTKQIYKLLLNHDSEPICIKKWHDYFGTEVQKLTWKHIFTFKIKK